MQGHTEMGFRDGASIPLGETGVEGVGFEGPQLPLRLFSSSVRAPYYMSIGDPKLNQKQVPTDQKYFLGPPT